MSRPNVTASKKPQQSNRWESFARADPYYYIDTSSVRSGSPKTVERFYESGRQTAQALLREVASLLPGRTLAIEIGVGAGRLLLGHVQAFERLRGVDISPRMLSLLTQRAAEIGANNVEAFLPDEPWDEPGASADYIYSYLVFQHIGDRRVIARYLATVARALRHGGIAQLQFDTRPDTALYRLRDLVPDVFLPRTQRRGIRRVRRDAAWIRAEARSHGLVVVSEREASSPEHWFVLRRDSSAFQP